MENTDNFSIRLVQNHNTEYACPLCGDSFTAFYVAVHQETSYFTHEPICALCAWETARCLASILHIAEAAEAFGHAETPSFIVDGLERRRNDPERFKRELQKAHDSILSGSPLGKFLKKRLKAALDSKDVSKWKEAMLLLEEAESGVATTAGHGSLDDEIPF